MWCAGRSASRSELRGSEYALRPGSSTCSGRQGQLSTIVEDRAIFVDNDVDGACGGFYRPTSAPMLRTVNG
jgi:hypothetical protein